ncbi:hypothetical protein [Variovorax sp. GB1P17]|uniref:hypothetical protein n=1 Tax=Variovorax sp. GB1P17 TaxID=3443740 RepID=UPI003F48126C
MTPEQNLAHLVRLIQPPTTNGWWEYVKARAAELAAQDSACAGLPALVKAERDRIEAVARLAKVTSTNTTSAAKSSP